MKLVTPPDLPTINVLLWGAPKTFKTTGACSLAKNDPVLLVNADLPNASRLAHRSYPGRILEPEMPVFNKENPTQIYELMKEISDEALKPKAQRQGQWGTVVIDTVGELYRRHLEEHSRRAVRPSLPAYGDVAVQVERFCRFLCEVPTINTVLICHEVGAGEGEERGMIPFTSTKSGSETLGNKLMAMVDIIGYTGIRVNDDGSKTPMAQLVAAKGRNAGARFNCLGNARELDVSEWLDRIVEHEKEGVVPLREEGGSRKLDYRIKDTKTKGAAA